MANSIFDMGESPFVSYLIIIALCIVGLLLIIATGHVISRELKRMEATAATPAATWSFPSPSSPLSSTSSASFKPAAPAAPVTAARVPQLAGPPSRVIAPIRAPPPTTPRNVVAVEHARALNPTRAVNPAPPRSLFSDSSTATFEDSLNSFVSTADLLGGLPSSTNNGPYDDGDAGMRERRTRTA